MTGQHTLRINRLCCQSGPRPAGSGVHCAEGAHWPPNPAQFKGHLDSQYDTLELQGPPRQLTGLDVHRPPRGSVTARLQTAEEEQWPLRCQQRLRLAREVRPLISLPPPDSAQGRQDTGGPISGKRAFSLWSERVPPQARTEGKMNADTENRRVTTAQPAASAGPPCCQAPDPGRPSPAREAVAAGTVPLNLNRLHLTPSALTLRGPDATRQHANSHQNPH